MAPSTEDLPQDVVAGLSSGYKQLINKLMTAKYSTVYMSKHSLAPSSKKQLPDDDVVMLFGKTNLNPEM